MNEQQIPHQPKPISDKQIDPLIVLVKTMWNGRKTIARAVVIGTILGVTIALFSAKEYSVSTVMVPQLGSDSQSKLGGLGGLAELAGINLDNLGQGNELSPMVYPQIVSSIPFQLELMNTPINFEDYPKPITIFDYYITYSKPSIIGIVKKYTVGLPFILLKAIRGKPKELVLPGDSANLPILLTDDQYTVKKIIDDLVLLDLNPKEGYITLTAQMPEALAAAQLAQKAQTLLQRYITEFKIEKVKANLHFIQGRYNEIKAEFEKAQVSLALVNDRNKNFTSGLPQIEADRIQTKYTISFNVFQELAKQLEQAKIQVKKETPVFAIIQPVTIPSEKSKPKRAIILFIWIFLGSIVGAGIVLVQKYFGSLEKHWNEAND